MISQRRNSLGFFWLGNLFKTRKGHLKNKPFAQKDSRRVIPSGLKNLLEWCVSTTVFSEKPVGLITASASGLKGHEELKLIMETIQANFIEETTLLIQGIKGKVNPEGQITDQITINRLTEFLTALVNLTSKR